MEKSNAVFDPARPALCTVRLADASELSCVVPGTSGPVFCGGFMA